MLGDRATPVPAQTAKIFRAAGLALDPTYVWDVSFQLSCAAVFALLALATPLSRLLALALPALPSRVAGWVAMPIAATLATAPIAYAHFGTLAPWSVPANVCALPLLAVGTWGSALSTLAYLLWEPVGLILEWVTFPALWLLVQVAWVFAV